MGAPLSQEKERSPHTATTWTDPENMMLRKAADTGHTGCDSTGGKSPEQADRQRVSGSRAGVTANRMGLSVRVMECSTVDCGAQLCMY